MYKRFLALDPSGTGTTGICLIENNEVTFQEFQSPNWKEHWNHIVQLIQNYRPKLVLYETTNYLNSRGKDMTSLFKLLGNLESLGHSEGVLVNQVKELKKKLFTQKASIGGISYSPGRSKGWSYQKQWISVHCLEAYLVWWLWNRNYEK